jgi:hypothetical protein
MNRIVIIIHDIHFPYQLFEDAIEAAKEHEAEFKAVFLTNEPVYENSDIQVGAAQQIIVQHMRYMHRRAAASHLHFTYSILQSPVLKDVVEATDNADKVFMDTRDAEIFNDWTFSREELLRRMPVNSGGLETLSTL